jgi:hypothetical protein
MGALLQLLEIVIAVVGRCIADHARPGEARHRRLRSAPRWWPYPASASGRKVVRE